MKERPILFSGPMVLAILAGRKTQTRRVVKLRDDEAGVAVDRSSRGGWLTLACNTAQPGCLGPERPINCPYGAPGDLLWVRERWAPVDSMVDGFDREEPTCVGYHADLTAVRVEIDRTEQLDTDGWNWEHWSIRWRPSIHMPRWASRLTLEVVNVRAELLSSISEEDARAEGVEPFPLDPEGGCWTDGTHRSAFEYAWGEINGWDGPRSWRANLWVWVVEFKVLP